MLSPTPIPTGTPAAVVSPAILSPKENQQFTNQQPVFNGTASPNQRVEIAIHSTQVLQGQTYHRCKWQLDLYSNVRPLPGTHTISITTTDPAGANANGKSIIHCVCCATNGKEYPPRLLPLSHLRLVQFLPLLHQRL